MSIFKIIENENIRNNYIYLPSRFINENHIQTNLFPQIIKLRQLNQVENIFLGWNGGLATKDDIIEISSAMLKNLKLSNGDYVKIIIQEVENTFINKIRLDPLTNYDYKLIEKNSEFFEENLLNQINVIYDGLIFPFMFYDNKNVILKVILDENNRNKGYVLTQDCEVEVIYKPPENLNDEKIMKNFSINTKILFDFNTSFSDSSFMDLITVKVSRNFIDLDPEKLDKLVSESICNISLFESDDKKFYTNKNILFRFADKSTLNKYFTNFSDHKFSNTMDDERKFLINSNFFNKIPYKNSIWVKFKLDDKEGAELNLKNSSKQNNIRSVITLPEFVKINTIFYDYDDVNLTIIDLKKSKHIFDNSMYCTFIEKYLRVEYFFVNDNDIIHECQQQELKNKLAEDLMKSIETMENLIINIDSFYGYNSCFLKFYLDCDLKLYTELLFIKLKYNIENDLKEKFLSQPFICLSRNASIMNSIKNLSDSNKIIFSNEFKTIYNYTTTNKSNRHLLSFEEERIKRFNEKESNNSFIVFLSKKEGDVVKNDIFSDESSHNVLRSIKNFYKNKSNCNITFLLLPKDYSIIKYLRLLNSQLNYQLSKYSNKERNINFVYVNLSMFNFNSINDIEIFENYLKNLYKHYLKINDHHRILFIFEGLERFKKSDTQSQSNQITSLINESFSYLLTKFLNNTRLMNEKSKVRYSIYHLFISTGINSLDDIALDFLSKNFVYDVSKIKFLGKEISQEILEKLLSSIEINTDESEIYENKMNSDDSFHINKLAKELSAYCQNYVIYDFHKIFQKIVSIKPEELNLNELKKIFSNYLPSNIVEEKIIKLGADFSNIGGLHNVKEDIYDTIVLSTKCSEIYNCKPPINMSSGLLLIGPPGCGKTLIASAVQKEFKINFYSIKGPEILNKYIGASEASVREIFENAKKTLPCIVFFDEFDSIAPKRGTGSSGVTDRVCIILKFIQ